MLIARPAAVFLCLCAVPLQPAREAVHLLGRPARRGRHLPRLDPAAGRACPTRTIYFDVAFVVVLVSLLVQGWTIAPAARLLRIALPRADVTRGAPSSICPASSSRNWSAIRWSPTAPICAAASAVLGQAHAGGARRARAHAGGGRRRARRRLRLSARAAGKGAGARPLLRRSAAAARARRRPARRLLRAGRRRRSARSPRSTACRFPPRTWTSRWPRNLPTTVQASAEAERHHPRRADRAAGAQGQQRHGDDGRPAACRAGASRASPWPGADRAGTTQSYGVTCRIRRSGGRAGARAGAAPRRRTARPPRTDHRSPSAAGTAAPPHSRSRARPW